MFIKDSKSSEFDQIDWQAQRQKNSDKLCEIFGKNSLGEPNVSDYTQKYFLRMLFPLNQRQRTFESLLSIAFTGGIYFGNPKFGAYEVLGGGVTKSLKGTDSLFVDFYPMERMEFTDWEDELSRADILEKIINDERLINQLQNYGVREVQTSDGLAVNLETLRPRVKIHQLANV